LRDEIFANQKRLGVIPANTELTPWPDGQAAYGGRSCQSGTALADPKKLYSREAEVFAAYAALYRQCRLGRVIQEVQDEGKLDTRSSSTLSGDNGTSAEGTLEGTYNQIDRLQTAF